MNPNHTPLEAAAAELERFDRLATDLGVAMAAPILRNPLEVVTELLAMSEAECDRLASLLMDATDRHDVTTTEPDEVF